MKIKIRDWDKHFERDRSTQWKTLKWVPIPNKQGAGYRKIMSEKNGLEIFACWISLVQVASTVEIRGDLSKYDLLDLSRLTMIELKTLEKSILYLSQTLDWIEIIENLDISVNNLDISRPVNGVDSSILSNSVLSNSFKKERVNKYREFIPPTIDEVKEYFKLNGYSEDTATRFFKSYSEGNPPWHDSQGKPVRSWKQKAVNVWFKPENKTIIPQTGISKKKQFDDFVATYNPEAEIAKRKERAAPHSGTGPEKIGGILNDLI